METKICSKCGEEKPLDEFYGDKYAKDGKFHNCKACVHEREVARYHADPEFHKRRVRQWEEDNPEKSKAYKKEWNLVAKAKGYFRQWYQNHRESERERNRKWIEDNPEKELEHTRRYNKEHKDKRKAWQLAHPDKLRDMNRRRRGRIADAEGEFTEEEFNALCEQYGNQCLRCGKTDVPLTPDHVVPLSKGGSNSIENIQPLCSSCNKSKGTKSIDYRPHEGQEG